MCDTAFRFWRIHHSNATCNKNRLAIHASSFPFIRHAVSQPGLLVRRRRMIREPVELVLSNQQPHFRSQSSPEVVALVFPGNVFQWNRVQHNRGRTIRTTLYKISVGLFKVDELHIRPLWKVQQIFYIIISSWFIQSVRSVCSIYFDISNSIHYRVWYTYRVESWQHISGWLWEFSRILYHRLFPYLKDRKTTIYIALLNILCIPPLGF